MAICGIMVQDGAPPIDPVGLQAMVSAMTLRRDDEQQHCASPQAGLGTTSGTGTASLWCSELLTVACDADLSNKNELQSRLSSPTSAGSEAELIASLYLKSGQSLVSQLRGIFSLAIWDKRRRRVLLAIDRFGSKPLCYAASPSQIVFSSYSRGIFASGRIEKQVNRHAIVNYLTYHVVPAPEAVFVGVKKLRPGEYVVWQDGHEHADHYWDLQYPEDARGSSESLARELLSRMEDGVRVTSRDFDPARIGCFLSGGTDSSSVLGLLSRLTAQSVKTFSIGFAERRFNELSYAQLAAKHFHADHTERILGPEEAYEAIPKMVEVYDEPFANSSAIPTYWCAKLARDHGVEVLLAGDGGDELFGGNERYREDGIFQMYQNIPGVLRRWAIEPAIFAIPISVGVLGKAQRYIRRSNTGNPERYCQWRLLQVFPPDQVLGTAMDWSNGNGDLLRVIRAHYKAAPARSELNRLLYIDIKMTLGDEDLPKVVRTSELAGINVRFPYLDHPLAEFTGRVPASLKVRGLEKRYLFKRATRDLLPEAILKKKKHGFGLPIGFWLKTDSKLRSLSREVLLDPKTYQRGYFRREFIERLFASLEQDDTPYFGDLLWVFLMLEFWHRRHVEGTAL